MPPEILTRVPEGCQLSRMLDESTLDQVMPSLGGKKVVTSDDTYWLYSVGEVNAKFRPYSKSSKGMLKVGVAVSVSQPELSQIANRIRGKKNEIPYQIDYHQSERVMPMNGNVKACLVGVVSSEIDALKSISLESIIARLEEPYPSVESKELEQMNHLAALAYTGNLRRLNEYLGWFKQGKRYNFRDSINLGTIEAALAIAHEQINK